MRKVLLAAAAAMLASPASAVVLYANNFNAENGGNTALNYNGFNGLTVTSGTVDLVKSGDFSIDCLGGVGACVDLDGSTGNSGLTSSNSFAFNAGDRVALNFFFSGNQRQLPSDSFAVRFLFAGTESGTFGYNSSFFGGGSLGSFNTGSIGVGVGGVAPEQGFGTFEFYFFADSGGSVSFNFEDFGNDNVGIVIDAVSLVAVPEPSTWAMMILGFGVIGGAARRRRTIAKAIAA